MNKQQNPDGSWSKAEPEKASWELKTKKRTIRFAVLQWRQLTAALFFLTSNMVYRRDSESKLTNMFYILAFIVFLVVSIQNLTIAMKAYKEVMKGGEPTEEQKNEEERN